MFNNGRKVTWDQLNASITEGLDQAVHDSMDELKADIQEVWPIDTGASKAAWKVEEQPSGWAVTNNLDYSAFLWEGLPRGSKQLPYGGDPIFQSWLSTLRKNIENIDI